MVSHQQYTYTYMYSDIYQDEHVSTINFTKCGYTNFHDHKYK